MTRKTVSIIAMLVAVAVVTCGVTASCYYTENQEPIWCGIFVGFGCIAFLIGLFLSVIYSEPDVSECRKLIAAHELKEATKLKLKSLNLSKEEQDCFNLDL